MRTTSPGRGSLPRRPTGFGVIVTSTAAFLAIVAILAWRMAAGQDPALGAGQQLGDTKAPAEIRPVIHRRVVKLRVIHDPAEPDDDAGVVAAVPVTPEAPATTVAPAPPPAPVTSAPAPAPAPPPVTSSS